MSVDSALSIRLAQLVADARMLEGGNEYGRVMNASHKGDCVGWVVAAQHAVHLACPNPLHPYRTSVDAQALACHASNSVNQTVGAVARVLMRLQEDIEEGLLTTVADHARAEVFDDFLDSAREYHRRGRKNEAGVIGGVVFEDTLRRLCDKHKVAQKDVALDQLISELTRLDVLTGTKGKRARSAAHVRTKATHAQWDEFDASDVSSTIELTAELIQLLDN